MLTKPALILKALFIISLFKPVYKTLILVAEYFIKEVMPMILNALKLVTADFIDTFKSFCISVVAGVALLT